MSKKMFLWYCSIDRLDISWNTLSIPTISWSQHKVQGSMQLIPDLLLTFTSICFVRFDLVLHCNFLNSTCMIFECANARSRPHSLGISPLVIARQHLAWPLRTKLQFPNIVRWAGNMSIWTPCRHLYLTKISAKWKQIFSDHFSRCQYLQFSTLHVPP